MMFWIRKRAHIAMLSVLLMLGQRNSVHSGNVHFDSILLAHQIFMVHQIRFAPPSDACGFVAEIDLLVGKPQDYMAQQSIFKALDHGTIGDLLADPTQLDLCAHSQTHWLQKTAKSLQYVTPMAFLHAFY